MNSFYCPDIQGETFFLDENDSKHAVRVLRKKIGDKVQVVDGKGNRFICSVLNDHPKKCELSIIERFMNDDDMGFDLHLVIAPIKSLDRLEFMLEKVTEIGVSEITFILSDHCIKNKVNLDRAEKKVISAMKQCLKARKPKINAMIPFKDFMNLDFSGQKLIAHCEDFEKKTIKQCYKKGSDAVLLIGPEGDFSLSEIKLAYEKGFEGVDLGKTRLRNETAGIVSVHAFHMINND